MSEDANREDQTTAEPQPGTRQIWVRTKDAAEIYGSADRTIRRWVDSGRLEGRKVNDVWMVRVSEEDLQKAGIDISQLEAEYGDPLESIPGTVVLQPTESQMAPVDLTSMVALIDGLTRQVGELSATNAMWQERARQLEAQLNESKLALEAGAVAIPPAEATIHEADMQRRIDEAIAKAMAERTPASPPPARSWWQKLLGS